MTIDEIERIASGNADFAIDAMNAECSESDKLRVMACYVVNVVDSCREKRIVPEEVVAAFMAATLPTAVDLRSLVHSAMMCERSQSHAAEAAKRGQKSYALHLLESGDFHCKALPAPEREYYSEKIANQREAIKRS